MSLASILDTFVQVVSGVMHLHGLGIIHRDLRTANVFVDSVSASAEPIRVVVADFSLSHLLSAFAEGGAPQKLDASHVPSVIQDSGNVCPLMVGAALSLQSHGTLPAASLQFLHSGLCLSVITAADHVFLVCSGRRLRFSVVVPKVSQLSARPATCTCLGACCTRC